MKCSRKFYYTHVSMAWHAFQSKFQAVFFCFLLYFHVFNKVSVAACIQHFDNFLKHTWTKF